MSGTRGKVTKHNRLGLDDRGQQPHEQNFGCRSGMGADDRRRQPHEQNSGRRHPHEQNSSGRSGIGADNRRRQTHEQNSGCHSGTGDRRPQPLQLFSGSYSGAKDGRRQSHPRKSSIRPGKYYSRGRVLIRGGKTTRPTNKGVGSHTVSQTFSYNSVDVDNDDEFYDDHTEENDKDDVDATLRESPLKSPASDSPANSQRFHPRDSPPDSQHYSPHNSRFDSQRDSNYRDGTRDISQRPPISRLGEGFGSNKVVRNIIGILKEHLEGPWVTFLDVPNDVVGKMYNRFKTCWSWDPRNEQMNYEGFTNVLKNRYRDIMAKMRYSGIKDAKKVGRVIERKDPKFFSKLSEFPPSHIHINIWRDMCKMNGKRNLRAEQETARAPIAPTRGPGPGIQAGHWDLMSIEFDLKIKPARNLVLEKSSSKPISQKSPKQGLRTGSLKLITWKGWIFVQLEPEKYMGNT